MEREPRRRRASRSEALPVSPKDLAGGRDLGGNAASASPCPVGGRRAADLHPANVIETPVAGLELERLASGKWYLLEWEELARLGRRLWHCGIPLRVTSGSEDEQAQNRR
jgi:hypothetical protein